MCCSISLLSFSFNRWEVDLFQSILKEISPGCSLEGLMLKLQLQYFGHLVRRADSLEKTDAGRDWRQEEKGTTEDEMAGWHHQLDGHEFGWTPGVGDGQGGLACCNSWGHKESDTTEWLNWTETYLERNTLHRVWAISEVERLISLFSTLLFPSTFSFCCFFFPPCSWEEY